MSYKHYIYQFGFEQANALVSGCF